MPRSPLANVLAVLALALVIGACSTTPESSGGSGSSREPDRQPGTRELTFRGPDQDAMLNAEESASLEFVIAASVTDGSDPEIDDLRIRLDGEDVTDEADVSDGQIVYTPSGLEEGERLVEVVSIPPEARVDAEAASTEADEAPADAPNGDGDPDDRMPGQPEDTATVLHHWSFAVDLTTPNVEVTSPKEAVIAGEPVTLDGVTEAGATVSAGGGSAEADANGNFSLELDEAAAGSLQIVATDTAGNAGETELELLTVPSRVEVEEIRSVHVSFCAWATPSLREPVLAMIEDGLINAVQLDLKDETGTIGFDTDIELAATIGSDEPPCHVDLDAAVEQLHGLGVPVVGRIVAFADPVLAPWAWENDRRDWVMQTADQQMYTGRYAGFSNFAQEEVVDYNLDIAEAAAAAGVDHILWDYIRKPDGAASNFHFAGLEGEPGDAIVEFTRLADERIAPYGVTHGASVYGVSADRPTEVAQDIAAMAEHLDYVAPMLYPSHWAPGEYGISDPLQAPYETIHTTLEIWLEATDGKRARVVPWLEDSNWPVSLGYPDRSRYVREQIQATYDRGINEWLLWDSAVRYSTSAITSPPS